MRLMVMLAMSTMMALAGGTGTVTAKGQTFQAEIAATPGEREQGLMRRASLAPNACMIFLYDEEGQYRIWMKNCLISLDVAWVDAEGRIVELVPDVPPPSPMRVYRSDLDYPTYGGSVPSRHFVEFSVGTFKRLGLKRGDRLAWDLKLTDGTVVKSAAVAKGRK